MKIIAKNKKNITGLIDESVTKYGHFNRQLIFYCSHFVFTALLVLQPWGVLASPKSLRFAPTVTTTGAPSALNTTYGVASASTNFSVSGSNLTQGILITPPNAFEVSIDNSTFTPTVTITLGTGGNIPPTTVYIRIKATTGAGSYSGNITLSSSGASNTVGIPTSTVAPASLTVTATDASKTYGQTLVGGVGSTAFTSTGLQNGETIGSVTTGYGPGSAGTDGVGNYGGCVTAANATGGTFNTANYTITYISGQIIVNPALLNVAANDVHKTYGQTLTGGPGSTAFTASGLQNGETIGTVTVAYGSGSAATNGVGTFGGCVTVANAIGGTFAINNYNLTYTAANIIVDPAPITITANDVTKVYGAVLTDYTGSTAFTASGLQNGEVVNTVSIYYGTGGQASYPRQPCYQCVVAANAAGTFGPNNYIITYVPGTINVTPAPLVITADNQVKLYGDFNPVLTVTYSGFVNGDGPAQITTPPKVTTTATIASPPGQYPITASGASASDYTITYVPGIFTVTESFTIPNAFTPNGDGINDNWHITFLENYQNCMVTVFNRSGQRVYFSNGYGTPWDGTYNGAPVPVGTYYYTIALEGIHKTLSGYLVLIR